MCGQCHQALSDETVIQQWKEALENPRFERWNTTSFSHLLITIRGANGEEAHKLGVELGEKFYKWFVGPSEGLWEYFGPYHPQFGLEPFPSIQEVRKKLDDAFSFYKTTGQYNKHSVLGKTEEEEIDSVLEYNTEEDSTESSGQSSINSI